MATEDRGGLRHGHGGPLLRHRRDRPMARRKGILMATALLALPTWLRLPRTMGGMVVAIQKELGLPIKFIGLGEQADDLQPFDAKQYAEALFSEKE